MVECVKILSRDGKRKRDSNVDGNLVVSRLVKKQYTKRDDLFNKYIKLSSASSAQSYPEQPTIGCLVTLPKENWRRRCVFVSKKIKMATDREEP
jgi:hypothetical protein